MSAKNLLVRKDLKDADKARRGSISPKEIAQRRTQLAAERSGRPGAPSPRANEKAEVDESAELKTTYTFSAGDAVWVPEETNAFKKATVKAIDIPAGIITVFDEDYTTTNVPYAQVFPGNRGGSAEACEDNTSLSFLHAPALLNNLKLRYDKNNIYTFTAHILLAVNPYQSLPTLYGPDVMKTYAGATFGRMPPHVYAIADRAYRTMKNSGKNQSVVVSGESGAGKTESCKHVMRFFAQVSGAKSEGAAASPNADLSRLEQRVLESNPILEAFGNAKTLRNINSSRFGKYTEIYFDQDARLAGASVVTYLLERARVVGQARNERNFHVFYQMLAGGSPAEKEAWGVGAGPGAFNYIGQSGCVAIDGVDDAANFRELRQSLTVMGVSTEDQDSAFSTLAGLLHLGNVNFVEASDHTDIAGDSSAALENASRLLGLNRDNLSRQIVTRVMVTGGTRETFVIPLTVQEAGVARDALARSIYGKLFDWIVARINAGLPCRVTGGAVRVIGVLDMAGFEVFESNHFEQFCINYANEKIQQYYNAQVLMQEQEIYALEGLQWKRVAYEDNQTIIDLVEAKPSGIFPLLDEECVLPKATDKTFCTKIHTAHSANEHLLKPNTMKGLSKKYTDTEAFVVKHFAGPVCYTASGFLAKNDDSLPSNLAEILVASTQRLLAQLYASKADEDEGPKTTAGKQRFASVTLKFQSQLNDLMKKLRSTASHFIRCIRPNMAQRPRLFDGPPVMQQLQYSGMLETLLVMQSGFPTRCAFSELYDRYAPLLPRQFARLKPNIFCEALLVALDLSPADFQMGLTKVFFRAGKLAVMDELTNGTNMEPITKKVMKWLARKRFKAAIFAVISIRRLAFQVKYFLSFRRFHRAGRFMMKIVRIWLPAAVRSRSSAEATARRAEMARIEAAQEEARREAERVVKAQQEEERRKMEAAAKAAAEEKQRQEEEQKKAVELKITTLSTTCEQLQASVAQEQQAKENVTAQLAQSEKRSETLKADLARETEQVAQLHTKVTATEQKVEQTEKAVAELREKLEGETRVRQATEAQLKVEQNTTQLLTTTLEDERRSNKTRVEQLLTTTQSDKSQIMAELQTFMAEKADVEQKLRDETSSRHRVEAEKAATEQALTTERATVVSVREELAGKVAAHKTAITAAEAATAAESQKLKEEIAKREAVEAQLNEANLLKKHAITVVTKQKIDLEMALQAQKQETARVNDALKSEQEVCKALNIESEASRNLANTTAAALAEERAAAADLRLQLKAEKLSREDDASKHATAMRQQEAKYAVEIRQKEVAIAHLVDEKKLADEETLEKESLIEELTTDLASERARVQQQNEAIAALEKERKTLQDRVAFLEKERQNLIAIAVTCQEAQQKIKIIYSSFKKDEDLARLLFKDMSFAGLARGAAKTGVLFKLSGGVTGKKWSERHCILNDNFLFTFGGPGDKAPKEELRIDGCSVQELQGAFQGRDSVFVLTKRGLDGAQFHFSGGTPEETAEWTDVVGQACARLAFV